MTRKNTHMYHVDEALFLGGQSITHQIKRVLDTGSYKLTVKWDGAPSIFVGHDPIDGQFFIATKSIFNKTPKLYKNLADITKNEPESKAEKLTQAFIYLKELNIPNNTILQGDLIFTNDSLFIRDGYVMAHANTLIYAWDMTTDEALKVFTSDIGVVFHTTYTGGSDLQTYTANFGVDLNNLDIPQNLWIKSADTNARFEIDQVPVMSESANTIVDIMSTLPSSKIGASIVSYYNSIVRANNNISPSLTDYCLFVDEYYTTKVYPKLKSDNGLQKAEAELEEFLSKVIDNSSAFYEAFSYVEAIQQIKNDILFQLNSKQNQTIFVEIDGKLRKTSHEGYVLIDTETGDAFKLVDRQNFSCFNFSDNVKKGWQKSL